MAIGNYRLFDRPIADGIRKHKMKINVKNDHFGPSQPSDKY